MKVTLPIKCFSAIAHTIFKTSPQTRHLIEYPKEYFLNYRKDIHYSSTVGIRPSLPALHFGCRIQTLWDSTRDFCNPKSMDFFGTLSFLG